LHGWPCGHSSGPAARGFAECAAGAPDTIGAAAPPSIAAGPPAVFAPPGPRSRCAARDRHDEGLKARGAPAPALRPTLDVLPLKSLAPRVLFSFHCRLWHACSRHATVPLPACMLSNSFKQRRGLLTGGHTSGAGVCRGRGGPARRVCRGPRTAARARPVRSARVCAAGAHLRSRRRWQAPPWLQGLRSWPACASPRPVG